jgi:ribosome-associated heat shock protein Hsp15
MDADKPVRIDKFLWAVRLYKTRTLASDACKTGRVLVNGHTIKPSREIEGGEILSVRKPPVTYTFRIMGLTGNRLPAREVVSHIENLTPESEMMKLDMNKYKSTGYREKGTGRPTKKERRVIDRWIDSFDN